MPGRILNRWALFYWPFALVCGTAGFWFSGADDGVSVLAAWSRQWPWLIPGWWLVFALRVLLCRAAWTWRRADALAMVAVVLFGAVLTARIRLVPRPDWVGVGFGEELDLYDLLGETFSFTELYDWSVPAGTLVELHNSYGSVRVRPSPDERIHLQVRKTVRASNAREAAELARLLSFRMVERDWGLMVSSNRDALLRAVLFRTSLDVSIPASSPLAVENNRGAIDIRGFEGSQTLYARDGGMRVIAGGGPLDAHALRGNVRVAFDRIPSGAVGIGVEEGSLRLELPPLSEAKIDGRVTPGPFSSDFQMLTATSVDGGVTVDGRVGASRASQADIYFRVDGGRARILDRERWLRIW